MVEGWGGCLCIKAGFLARFIWEWMLGYVWGGRGARGLFFKDVEFSDAGALVWCVAKVV